MKEALPPGADHIPVPMGKVYKVLESGEWHSQRESLAGNPSIDRLGEPDPRASGDPCG
jgi:hypothetical protein